MEKNTCTQPDKVKIEPYNNSWPLLAQEEIAKLKGILPVDLVRDIQHVGSTAIHGLDSKPIIDLYVGVTDINEAKHQLVEPIKKLDYQYWDENPNPEKMFFVKGMPPFGKQRTHHIHIVEYGSDYWEARILFRNFLRTSPDLAKQYADLKKELSLKFENDREGYTDAKYDFVVEVLTQAGFKKIVRR